MLRTAIGLLLATTIITPCFAETIIVRDGGSIADAAAKAQSGDTILVESGTYEGGIHTSKDGVSYKADGLVVIKGGSDDYGWRNDGENSDVTGFKLDGSGSKWRIGLWQSGSNSTLSKNTVENVGQNSGCSNRGGAGILTDSYHGGKNIDVISNTVRNIGTGRCNFVQGIYIQAPESEIRNNKVDKVSGWGIHGWHDAGDLEVTGNVVSRGASGGIAIGGGGAYFTDGVASNVKITGNTVYSEGIGINPCGGKCGGGNVTADNTVVKSGDEASGGGVDSGDTVGDKDDEGPVDNSDDDTSYVSRRDKEFRDSVARYAAAEERQGGLTEDQKARLADTLSRYEDFKREHDLCEPATADDKAAFDAAARADGVSQEIVDGFDYSCRDEASSMK